MQSQLLQTILTFVRFRTGVIGPPEYRGDVPEDARRVTWLELLYDLVFVIAIGQVTKVLIEDFTFIGFAKSLLLCGTIWWAWVGQTFYLTRFDSDDISHRIITMVLMFFVMIMALQVPHAIGPAASKFALSYFAIRLILVYQYLRAAKHIPFARALCYRYAAGFSIAASLWIVSTRLDTPANYFLWCFAIVIDLMVPAIFRQHGRNVLPHMTHLPERFGLFTLIVIGEAILAVVSALNVAHFEWHAVVASISAWLAAAGLWWAYFEGVHATEQRKLSNSQEQTYFQIWMYGHLPLAAGIITMAASMNIIISLGPHVKLVPEQLFIYVLGCQMAAWMLNIIYFTSPSHNREPHIRQRLVAHNLTNISMLMALPIGLFLPAWYASSWVAICWITHIVLGFREWPEGSSSALIWDPPPPSI